MTAGFPAVAQATASQPRGNNLVSLTWHGAGSQGRAVHRAAVPHRSVTITGTCSTCTLGSQLSARPLELGVAHNAGTAPDVFALAAGV